EKSAFSISWPSVRSMGFPDSNGRVCPYWMVTYPALVADMVNRPAGRSRNSNRPSASGIAPFDPMSGLLMRTLVRAVSTAAMGLAEAPLHAPYTPATVGRKNPAAETARAGLWLPRPHALQL